MAADLNAVHLALRAQAKPALPTYREHENVTFTPPATAPYSEEDFVPATLSLRTVTAQGGMLIGTGVYVLRWFGVAGDGTATMNAGLTALLARFPIGLSLSATDGTEVRIGSIDGPRNAQAGPQRGQIINLDNGRPVATVRVPFWFESVNAL